MPIELSYDPLSALSDNDVWAEGLLIFYEVFRFLEEHLSEDIIPTEYRRTAAFEADLNFYLGSSWRKGYKPRAAVQKYINHLNHLNDDNPTLLIAYVYHLYMGLLSGGQILKKKRDLAKKIIPLMGQSRKEKAEDEGIATTNFGTTSIMELKKKMRDLIDNLCDDLNNETKDLLLIESRKVFELNNEIVRTVHGVNRVNLKKIGYIAIIIFGSVCAYNIYNYLIRMKTLN